MVHAGQWCAPAHPAPPSHFYPHLMPYERYCLHPSTCFSTGTLHAAPITSACLPLPHRLRRLMPPGQPQCTLFSIACFTCNIPRQLNSSVASESRVPSRLHAVSCNGSHAAAGQQTQRRQAGSRAQPHSAAPVGGPAQGLGAAGRAQPSVGCLRLPSTPRISAAGGRVPFPTARHVRRCACCVPLLRSSKRDVRLRTLLPPPLCKPSAGSAASPAALHSHADRR